MNTRTKHAWWLGTSTVARTVVIGSALMTAGTLIAGPAAAATHVAKSPSVLAAKRGSLGTILVTPTGLTLYTFSSDTKNHSTCTGGCASVWPPDLLAAGVKSPTAGKGVTQLGAIKRGSRYQITEKGRPLYTFAGKKSGDTSGNGLNGFSVVKVASA